MLESNIEHKPVIKYRMKIWHHLRIWYVKAFTR